MIAGRFSPYISSERYNAFLYITRQRGIPVESQNIKMCNPEIESATQTAIELLSQPKRPTAVFASNDIIASGTLKAAMNNYSVILLLNYRGTRVLLPGDTNCVGYAGLERELRADLFKLGHHGQKDSVTPELLEFISPRHAVCCASSDRRYNSAHPAPLGLLRTHGVHCWFSDCPEGEAVPPHSELTFTIGPDGAVEGVYR